MTERDKLAELLADYYGVDPAYYGVDAYDIADHFLANGVTIQKWIPVTERLPKEYTKVLAIDRVTGKVDFAQINAFGCFVYADGRGHGASHWMPLPSTEGLK